MLEKQLVIDRREILEDGTIQVRRALYILENGVRIAGPVYSRVVYPPGADVSREDDSVKRLATAEWAKR